VANRDEAWRRSDRVVTDDYVAWGGRAELERRVRAPMLPPATRALFGRIGVASPARFRHVLGVAAALGRDEAAPHGALLVVDGVTAAEGVMEEDFRVVDVAPGHADAGRYDVVYTRFLLSRVPCPGDAVAWMARQLAPSGVLVVEDIQCGSGSGVAGLLRAVGLRDVGVCVDPLPRTVQAWGRR